ncbi:site-specific DNA-methyltransferase [Nostocoides jenkinsii]|uniref:Site-specific DNA-methyltransferase (Adenine-specific) n=1 Tax=Nostocoides jenkinsii Ben 74 TaxID=1193518 RepID=A0A077MEV4_9MICO|nr:site-specific DNA-methyltransferase [Tetrasphaera jenkinsii]CCI53553.1 Site-specific DNA-methyltransferase (Adenine-specific) [Tetrasphaera jenkinsii Ben 74]
MTSPDLTAANVEKLADLFPTVITESVDADGNRVRAVDFDLLRQELSDHIVEGPQERYQLDWPGKRAAAFAANAPIAKTLRPVREESVDFDTTRNLFIEGDNLDALKLLQESYLGKIKLIYIDPPYNTGNDFVYEDDFAETTSEYLARSGQRSDLGERLVANPESNGRYHSAWLSMMYPRLKLARSLLAEDGILIVAIDDHEHGNVRALLELVFGGDNFLANVAWQGSGKNDARFTAGGLDYMLIFARNRSVLVDRDVRFKGPKRGYEDVVAAGQRVWEESGHDAKRATELFRAWWRSKPDVEAGLKAYSEIDQSGQIYTRDNLASPNPRENLMYDVHHPVTGQPVPMHENGWRLSREAMAQRIEQGRILFGADHSTTPRFKRLLSDMETQAIRPVVSQERAPASDALARLLGGKYFDYPKDTGVLATWINATTSTDKNAVIMDFFAGSGSTGHAVMEMNAADGGHRRYILVQLDEAADHPDYETIASIARERLRRAGASLKQGAGLLSVDLDFGFRSLQVDTSNMADTLETPDALAQLALSDAIGSVKADRTDEDLLFQVLLDWGLDLSVPIVVETVAGRRILSAAEDALVACFSDEITEEVIKEIASRHPLRAVFLDAGFVDDAARINAEQIFREVSPETELRAI